MTSVLECRPPRFFVSYRRRAQADARLAAFLVERLKQEGCHVFVDVEMRVGIDWSLEIDRRVAWCDFLVVLLSEESAVSEMVQGEVRRAHRLLKPILPVRVAFTDALSYELDSYVGKLQYVLWQSIRDNERVLNELLRAVMPDGRFGDVSPLAPVVSAAASDRPDPKADMRLLRTSLHESIDAPGSALDCENPFYIRRAADDRVEQFATGKARTLVIQAPSQTGKSSLLLRYLARCMSSEKKVAFVDLMPFGDVRGLSFPDFAALFVDALLRELEIQGVTPPTLKRGVDFTNFMEDTVLARVDAPFVIAIDDVDRAVGATWQGDFYATLRTWDANRSNQGKKQRWGRLGLALVIATDPTALIVSGYQSPFNQSPPLVLAPFGREGLDKFNLSYKEMLASGQLDRLFELLRGHCYLTPLAFYRLLYEEITFDDLCGTAHRDDGPFADHLRSKLDRLHGAQLKDAMREVVFKNTVPDNDQRLFYRLEAAGLVRKEGARILASNGVYERFFRTVL